MMTNEERETTTKLRLLQSQRLLSEAIAGETSYFHDGIKVQEYLQDENLLLLPFSVQKLCEQIHLAIFDYAEDKKSRNAILEKCLNEITGALEEVETMILNKYFATRKSLSDKVIRGSQELIR